MFPFFPRQAQSVVGCDHSPRRVFFSNTRQAAMMDKDQKEALQIAKELTAKLIECRTVYVGNVTEVFPRIYRCVYKTITDETGQKESAGE